VVAASDEEQIVDESLESLNLQPDVVRDIRPHGAVGIAVRDVECGRHVGHGGSKLVGCIGDEASLPVR